MQRSASTCGARAPTAPIDRPQGKLKNGTVTLAGAGRCIGEGLGIPFGSGLRVAVLVLAGAILAGCEDLVYAVKDNPEVVRILSTREVTIMERKF